MATLGAGGLHSLATAVRQRTTNYTYDALDRLVGVSGAGQLGTSYAYDPVGNRTLVQPGAAAQAATYDRADRLTTLGPYTAATDADGDLAGLAGAGVSDTFTYDQANRLTSATVNGTTVGYSYDGDGDRASLTSGGTTTKYVLDLAVGPATILSDGSKQYVFGPAGLAYAMDASNAVTVYHQDGLGRVRAITDGNGNVVQTFQTDAFGNPANPPGSQGALSQPFGYTGQPVDPLGLVDLRARLYSPVLGRFLQRDPLFGNIGAPLTLNRYSYALNNPLLLTDPSGLSSSSKALQPPNCLFPDPHTGMCGAQGPSVCLPFVGCVSFAGFPIEGPKDGTAGNDPQVTSAASNDSGSKAGLWSLPRLRNADLAEAVVNATGGIPKLAGNGKGYIVNIAFRKGRDIVVRIMDEGGPRTNYYRVGVDSKASYTIADEQSTGIDAAHIPIDDSSLEDILRLVNGIKSGLYKS